MIVAKEEHGENGNQRCEREKQCRLRFSSSLGVGCGSAV